MAILVRMMLLLLTSSHSFMIRTLYYTRTHRRHFASVTGQVYQSENPIATITLFTKEGCTLCDKVKDVLQQVRHDYPHSLEQVDITDPEHREWFDKYKYDIPVCHANGKYWMKHRLTVEQAREAMESLQNGTFESPKGEPNAAAMER